MLLRQATFLLVLGFSTAAATAQQWSTPVVRSGTSSPASQLFAQTNYDFGSVARAAKCEHAFEVKNHFNQDLHLLTVRSSCGCTTPRIEQNTLKPGESTHVIAHFNTDRFTGQRGATLTVVIDKPNYIEIPLHVSGYIRTDIVIDPPQVNFGQVDRGSALEKKFIVNYAGRNDWSITDIKPSSPYLNTKIQEKSRANGRVSYEVTVTLDSSAPSGYLQDQLLLKTNDSRGTTFPVMLDGRVIEELAVSSTNLNLGTLHLGDSVTKQLVLKGKAPFKVLSVQSPNEGFSFRTGSEEKNIQIIGITYAGTTAGPVTGPIRIRTTLGDKIVEVTPSGEVLAPLAVNQSDP